MAEQVEIICSSARRTMQQDTSYHIYNLLGNNLALDTEQLQCWPLRTDVWCWHCCHPFDDVPLCVPRNHRNQLLREHSKKYEVYGVFCSLNCAKAHVMEHPSYELPQVLLLLQTLMVEVFGIQAEKALSAHAAPSKAFLKQFGGHMSIEQFRQSSIVGKCAVLTPPFVSMPLVLKTSTVLTHRIRGLQRPSVPECTSNKNQTIDHRSTGVCIGLQNGGLYDDYCAKRRKLEHDEHQQQAKHTTVSETVSQSSSETVSTITNNTKTPSQHNLQTRAKIHQLRSSTTEDKKKASGCWGKRNRRVRNLTQTPNKATSKSASNVSLRNFMA